MDKTLLATIKSTVKDNEIFDEKTGHKLVDINGQPVEMKYCTGCKKRYPLSSFYRNARWGDGFQSKCKNCFHDAYVKRKPTFHITTTAPSTTPMSNPAPADTDTTPVSPQEKLSASINELVSKTLAGYEERIKSLYKEIGDLKSENARKRDLTKLSERDIESVLQNHSVAPRILFNAIARQDKRYRFSCYDTVTGLTCQIKTEVA